MKQRILFCTLAAVAVLPVAARAQSPQAAAAQFDYLRYEGRYYEIARLPNSRERDCASDVVTTFIRRTDGDVSFVNQCIETGGKWVMDIGRLDLGASDLKSGELRFRADEIGFRPWYRGTYRLVELAADYSHVMFGTADGASLWILSRARQMNDDVYARLAARARERGYDVSKLVRSVQNGL